MKDEQYGDLRFRTSSACCEECGRPYLEEKHGIVLDGMDLSYNGQTVRLTERERDVAALHLKHFGTLVHSEVVYAKVWGSDSEVALKIVDVIQCKLRRKLRSIGLDFRTTWGYGKALVRAEDAPADPRVCMREAPRRFVARPVVSVYNSNPDVTTEQATHAA